MLFLQRAFLLGLAAASLVTSRTTGNAPDHGLILKRGVPEPPGDARVPLTITLDGVEWTRAEILDAIKNNAGKPFKNHGVEWKGNKWVPKDPLFEGGGKLTEIDLTKSSSRGKFRAIVSSGNKKLKGEVDHQDMALCYVGDGLLMTPLAPLGIAVHIIRWFISLAKPPSVPEKEVFMQHRDSQWEKFLADHVYTYIYSDSKEPSNSKEKTFRAKLSSTLNIRGLTIVSEDAQKIGAAKAVAQKSLKASKDDAEKAEIEKASVEVVEGIRAVMWNDTLRSQRDYLLGLPDALRDQSKASLKPLGEAFNDNYVKNIASIQMARTFYQPDRFNRFPAYPGEKPGNLGPVQSKLRIIAAHVKNAPLPLPKTFSLAYILGQSKGLEGLDPGVLSPRDYLRDQKAPMKLSEDHINFLSIFHTLEVTKLLHGYIKEDQLRNPWKSEIKDARPLRLLIAMKFGKIVEERKGSGASGPDILPLLGWDSAPLLAAITGLSEEIARSLPMGEEYLPYKDEGLISEKMIMAMLRLAQSWSAPNGNKGQTIDKAEI
ncbi:hypothetical protein ACQRIU_007041 [Beauveria bassiana]